jgi:hypothetical protein
MNRPVLLTGTHLLETPSLALRTLVDASALAESASDLNSFLPHRQVICLEERGGQG